METTEAVPTDVSVLLSADVHQDQANFTEIVRDLIDSTNVKPSEEIVRDRVELLLSTVGRNLLKLHGLVQVVYAEISSGSPWARSVGVRFYRALFKSIDPTFELEVFGKNLLGAEVAVQFILDATDDFRAR